MNLCLPLYVVLVAFMEAPWDSQNCFQIERCYLHGAQAPVAVSFSFTSPSPKSHPEALEHKGGRKHFDCMHLSRLKSKYIFSFLFSFLFL